MPLTLVLGPANSAKAGEVLGAYQLAAAREALLVVPTAADAEHYDRELAVAHGVSFGRTLTFPRLFDEIAGRAGFHRTRITPLQRERLLRLVISELELPSLARSAGAPGFARAVGRLIAELGQARASAPRFAAALRSWAAGSPERERYARDLGAIHLRYTAELERREALDAEGFAWAALDAARLAPDRWRATAVFLYGFDDLTAIELDALTTLAGPLGAPVTVSLTYEPDRSALAARAGVVEELRAHAASVRQLPALDTYYEPGPRAALHHLERELFEPSARDRDPGDAVVLLEAGGERAEAELVADEVAAALRRGAAPEEIVVVCRSLQRSGAPLERALAGRGIATASARRSPLSHTSLGRALLALARCAFARDAGADALLAYLRAPGVVADVGALDRFEARVRRSGAAGLAEALRLVAGAELPLGEIELLRRAEDPASALAAAIRRLLAAPNLRAAPLLGAGAELDARAAATVLDALAETATIDHTPAQLLDLLAGLELRAAGAAAPGCVLVAEPLAIRARRFRHVFVTGLCEGEFPSPQALAGDPFLGEDGRRELALASGLVLAAPADPVARERYLLYACVSRATERVTVSYRSCDEDGTVVLPSPFLDDLEQVLGTPWRDRRHRRLLGELPNVDAERPAAPQPGLAEPPQPGHAEPPQRGQTETRTLGPAARRHVRHTRVVSGGALESFAACPVRWLVESQLNPAELRPEAEPLAKGSFMHQVLERVFSSLGAALTPATLPLAERAMETAIVASEIDVAPGRPPEVRAALLRGIEADLRRYLRHEAGSGNGWMPTQLELRFGFDDEEGGHPGLVLDAGDPANTRDPSDPDPPAREDEPVVLRGVIDRIDVEPGGERAIVRDYKSGRRQPDWGAEHWARDGRLQVALYMLAARRLLDLEPVAGLYHPLTGDDLRPRGARVDGVETGSGGFQRDRLSAPALDELLEEIRRIAVELARRLRAGELTPCPETCSGLGGGGCRHPDICWADS